MSNTKNIETVRGIYAAFGRQDVPAIVELVADDCDWDYAYPEDHEIPWLRRRRGRDGVAAFFGSLAVLDFTRFEVNAVLGEGDLVVALCDVEATVRATGKKLVEKNEVHVWHFDSRGRVSRFRHAADTLAHSRALG
jgi:ketosteroid isomerase-like protein